MAATRTWAWTMGCVPPPLSAAAKAPGGSSSSSIMTELERHNHGQPASPPAHPTPRL